MVATTCGAFHEASQAASQAEFDSHRRNAYQPAKTFPIPFRECPDHFFLAVPPPIVCNNSPPPPFFAIMFFFLCLCKGIYNIFL